MGLAETDVISKRGWLEGLHGSSIVHVNTTAILSFITLLLYYYYCRFGIFKGGTTEENRFILSQYNKKQNLANEKDQSLVFVTQKHTLNNQLTIIYR